MNREFKFIKMQGIGNDFVVIDGFTVSRAELAAQTKVMTRQFAAHLCDRRFGVGADQILWIKPARSKKAFARMEVLNPDGSSAEMCGNGIRAVALYLHGAVKKPRKSYVIETLAGLLSVEILGQKEVRVDMGRPNVAAKPQDLRIEKKAVSFWEVSMGNPHAVIFLDGAERDLATYPVEKEGALIESHRRFPHRTNVEYVRIESSRKIQVRVWERGAGITLACGSGACASAVAAIRAGLAKSPVEVRLPGGTLQIEWSGSPCDSVFMTGPAEEVFRGKVVPTFWY